MAEPGGGAPRSWQFWERGERTIPADVIETMSRLLVWRAEALSQYKAALAALAARHGAPVTARLVWYQTADDWASVAVADPLLWRPHCSVAAEIAADYGAELIPFDPPAYSAWLGKRKDSDAFAHLVEQARGFGFRRRVAFDGRPCRVAFDNFSHGAGLLGSVPSYATLQAVSRDIGCR